MKIFVQLNNGMSVAVKSSDADGAIVRWLHTVKEVLDDGSPRFGKAGCTFRFHCGRKLRKWARHMMRDATPMQLRRIKQR